MYRAYLQFGGDTGPFLTVPVRVKEKPCKSIYTIGTTTRWIVFYESNWYRVHSIPGFYKVKIKGAWVNVTLILE